MGFTPTGGLMMGTRSGDLDPGVLLYLLQEKGMSPPELNRLVNRQAGLLGVSGSSADMRDLLGKAATDPPGADQAAAPGPLGNVARLELDLRPPESPRPGTRRAGDLSGRPGARRTGGRRQRVPRRDLLGGLTGGYA